mmetsp:Transcript_8897/g.30249  ORF Transcript_8897/g.30249 Transcript_8897/m.30249 type:complete len:269 (-) Transcript_8897:901-1707(-)
MSASPTRGERALAARDRYQSLSRTWKTRSRPCGPCEIGDGRPLLRLGASGATVGPPRAHGLTVAGESPAYQFLVTESVRIRNDVWKAAASVSIADAARTLTVDFLARPPCRAAEPAHIPAGAPGSTINWPEGVATKPARRPGRPGPQPCALKSERALESRTGPLAHSHQLLNACTVFVEERKSRSSEAARPSRWPVSAGHDEDDAANHHHDGAPGEGRHQLLEDEPPAQHREEHATRPLECQREAHKDELQGHEVGEHREGVHACGYD